MTTRSRTTERQPLIARLDAPPARRTRLLVELAVIGVLTFGLYARLWAAQRALFAGAFANSVFNRTGPRPDLGVARQDAALAWVVGPLLCALFLWLVLRAPALQRARLSIPALVVPAVVGAGLFLLPPTLSDDSLSYLSHGYLAATPGANPYVDASKSVAQTAYGQLLLGQNWTAAHPATPYGPIWTTIERTAYVLSGNDVPLGLLLLKVPALLSVVVIGLLIWRHLRRHHPDRALLGCLLFVANPLVLIELTGDGHNDALLAALLLGAILATAGRRAFLAVLLIALAVLTKTSVLPFAVPIAVHLFVNRRAMPRLVPHALLAIGVAAALGVVLIAPSWRGAETFSGLRSGGSLMGWSVAGGLKRAAELAVAITGVSAGVALLCAQAVLLVLLLGGTLLASRGAGTTAGLLSSSVVVSLVVLLLLPMAWPWYATVPLALLPLIPDRRAVVAVVVFAITSRLGAPIADTAQVGLLPGAPIWGVQTFIIQTVPCVVALVLLVQRRTRTQSPQSLVEALEPRSG